MLVDSLARALWCLGRGRARGFPVPVVHLGGGPARFMELLDAQLSRRAAHRVPQIDPDPAWVVALPTERHKERVAETLGTLGNGSAATRGTREEDGEGPRPLPRERRLHRRRLTCSPDRPGPASNCATVTRRDSERRLIDLHTGTLVRSANEGAGLRSMRFVSAASPHAMALRAEAVDGPASDPASPLRPPPGCRGLRTTGPR